MIHLRKALLIAAAILATGAGARAADTAAPTAPTAPKASTVLGKVDLQRLIEQFNSRRDAIVANHDALLNQLKNATADQKKAIWDKLEAQQKDLLDQQRALGRQIRDEMRKLKQTTPATRH